MLLKYFYDRSLAQASYMVACQRTGEAIVIDPARDIRPYLDAARTEGFRIAHITETHIHADFVSGARELLAATGAQLYLSAMGGPDWQYDYPEPFTPLRDGDAITIGNVRLHVMHTPGHTPEHIVFILTDGATADRPMGIFTGDFLFVGDIGRPDLLEVAAKVANTKEIGARQQFQNVQRFKNLPDYLQIWPGHGAGSACGKALGAVPSTTLGYEKLFNPAFQFDDEAQFVDWLLTDQPEPPRYFAQMKRVNRVGPTLMDDLTPPGQLEGFFLADVLKAGAVVIDARSAEEYQSGHVRGTISISPGDKFNTYAGDFIDFDAPTYLIAPPEQIEGLVRELREIGVDNLPGYFAPRAIYSYSQPLPGIDVTQLAQQLERVYLLDVRSAREYHEGHIPGAHHVPLGQVEARLAEYPRDRRIVVQCGSGVRSQIAASVLQRHGLTQVVNLNGGIDEWKAANLPVVTGEGEAVSAG